MGQGKDYVYHGTNVFKGIHKGDILTLSDKQIALYNKTEVHQIYPEYWVIKVSMFGNLVNDKLDEWIYFLKNSEVKDTFSAKGLKEAGKKLDSMKLSEKERIEYNVYLKRLRDIASEQHTQMADAQDLILKGREELQKDIIIEMYKDDVPVKTIAKYLKTSEEKVSQVIEKYKKNL